MPKRCKHLTGQFIECIIGTHMRNVENGVLDRDSFNNEYDGLLHHEYVCQLCGNTWKWKSKPRQKWLSDLFINAYKSD